MTKQYFKIFTTAIVAAIALSCNKKQDNSVVKDNRDDRIAIQFAQLDSVWQKQFGNALEIITLYDSIRVATSEEEKELQVLNQCHYVWQSGEYMFRCRGKNSDIYELPKHDFALSLDNGIVSEFATGHKGKGGSFVDHYFTLNAMKQGESFNEARDGITATVFYPIRALNDNDYNKLREIFSSKSKAIHEEYLERLKFPISSYGCTSGLKSIEPLIEQNVADSELKREVLELYETFSRIMPGEPAPLPILKDIEGNEHTFAEMKGKVIVINVWATWCHSCLENMRKFMGMRYKHREQEDVCFITLSIDRKEDRDLWIRAIEKHNMQNMLNLYPDCEEQSQFETDYQVSSVPRYIIIGKDGNIVSAHAPAPSREMSEMIEYARVAEFYSGPGTSFLDLTLDEAIAKAQAENKHIFIECHTEGCVPCKMMEDKVFKHNKCADYFNKEFICLSINDEEGEGPAIIEKNNVHIFPTYIILEPDGELAGAFAGTEMNVERFIEKIEQIKDTKE